jgi:hypothetical protein
VLIVLDVETSVVDLDAGEVPELICTGFYEPATGKRWITDARDTVAEIERAIEAGATFLGHNLAFDWTVVRAYAGWDWRRIYALYNQNRVRDTLVRQQLLDVRNGYASDASGDADENDHNRAVLRHARGDRSAPLVKSGLGLADLELYYFGRDRTAEKKNPNSVRLRFGELKGLRVADYPKEFTDYLYDDVSAPFDVYEAQAKAWRGLGGADALPDEVRQVRKALALSKIERRGMATYAPRIDALAARAAPLYAAAQEKVREAKFYRLEGDIDTDDPKRTAAGKTWLKSKVGSLNKRVVQERVVAAYKKLGKAAPMTSGGKSGKPAVSINKDSLLNSGDPLLMEFSGAGPIGSIVNTFVPMLKAGNGRLRTRYNGILATGRISSAKPNLNNLPRGNPKDPLDLGKYVRPCVVPTEGFDLCSVDYDCAEIRSHAQVNLWLFKKSAQAEFFQQNPYGDPHLDLASSILGITVEEAKRRYDAGDETVKDARQASKALNFGLPGGMGAPRLQDSARKGYKVEMDLRTAELRKKQWKRRWPEMSRYFAHITAIAENRGEFEQLCPPGFGPHRIRGRSVSEPHKWFSQAANSYFQGLTADGAAEALWLVTQACDDPESPLYGSYVVGWLYDELLVEIPSHRSHEGAQELARLMIQGMQTWLPDVPVTAKPTLMDRWSKEAKPVYVNGRLVPWRPSVDVSS